MLEVKQLRLAREWNQTELAFHAGLAPSVISEIENGKRDPSARTLRKLAEAFEVDVADLFPKAQPQLPLHDRVAGASAAYTAFEAFGQALAFAWEEDLKEWDEKIPDGSWADSWDFARLVQWALEVAGTKAVYQAIGRELHTALRPELIDTMRLLDEADQAAKKKVLRAFEPVKTFKEFRNIWEASDMDAIVSEAGSR